jgi:Family of unknown function (DUF6281)
LLREISRRLRMNMPKPLRLVILLTVVVLASYFAFQSVSRPPDPESVGRTGTIGVSGPGVSGPSVQGGENPLGSGGEISLETATSLIRRCLCPQLPPSGPLSLERVEAAWTDSSGQLVLEYDDGIRLYYVPDERTEDTYVADWKQAISDGWPGTIIPLRQTGAAAAERDFEGPAPGPAVVTWLEGPYHLSMHGDGGQGLAELIQLAESLPTATDDPTRPERAVEESGDARGGVQEAASCAFVVNFGGHHYDAIHVNIEPIPGEPLGTATSPACDDIGDTGPQPDHPIQVAELPGFDPDVALVWLDKTETIFVRQGMIPLPPEIAKLLFPPGCDPVVEPISLAGPWLSILGADGNTEVDLVPPYDVGLLVQESSAFRYKRAHLTIRVPASLGRPLTREDVRSSLWDGGTIAVTARCKEGRFIADKVET